MFTNNTKWGLWFDDGRQLSIRGGRCEGNGQTALGSDYGGMFVGQNSGGRIAGENSTGLERVLDGSVTGYGRALFIQDVWFEGNIGNSDIWFNGGANKVSGCYFRTGSTYNVQDIRITNGTYRLEDNIHSVGKTNVINEESGVSQGNYIIGSRFIDHDGDINYNPDKTTLMGIANRFMPHVIACGAFRILGADNTVSALGGSYRNTGITSITRSAAGVFDVALDTTWSLPNNPLVSITGFSGAGAAYPVHYSVTGLGTDGNFSIQLRRIDGTTSALFDPTTDSVNRDFQVIVYS